MIIFSGEALSWQVDASFNESRKRQRRQQILATVLGATLALFVLGNALGVGWLLSAVAGSSLTAAQQNAAIADWAQF